MTTATTTEAPAATFTIPTSLLETALDRLKRANGRARRVALPGYTWATADADPVPVWSKEAERLPADQRALIPPLYYRPMTAVTVTGAVPVVKGWAFVGTMEHDEYAGVITRPMPGVEISFDAVRGDATTCDQCHTNRDRHKTYVLRSETTGELQRVGSTCLGLFLGLTVNLTDLALSGPWRDLEALADEDGWPSGDGGDGGFFDSVQPVRRVIELAVGSVALGGYTSRQQETERRPATVEIVRSAFGRKGVKLAEELTEAADPGKVDAVLAFARTIEGDSEYCENLRRIAGPEYVTGRNVGILASAVAAYGRHVARGLKSAAVANSSHVGAVGERVTFAGVEVLSIRPVDARAYHYHDDTTQDMIKFVAAGGNVLIWMTKSRHGLHAGDRVDLVATIKRHGEYRGVAETTLTRCRITQAA